MKKYLMILTSIIAMGLMGCSDEDNSKCKLDTYLTNCDGNVLQTCVEKYDNIDDFLDGIGSIERADCGLGVCATIENQTACFYNYFCDELGAQRGVPECVIEDLNQPAMYAEVCIQDEIGMHWNFQKVEDCDGVCIIGENKCYQAGDECPYHLQGYDMGCHGNEFYYCGHDMPSSEYDEEISFHARVHKFTCDEGKICQQTYQGTGGITCSRPCENEGEVMMNCANNEMSAVAQICAETPYGLYSIGANPSYIYEWRGDLMCVNNKVEALIDGNPCDPSVDKAYCSHNAAVRCIELSDGSYEWRVVNCASPEPGGRMYGKCEIIEEDAYCIMPCLELEVGRVTYECNDDEYNDYYNDYYNYYAPHDKNAGMHPTTAFTYECREMYGYLYEYPIEIQQCEACNEEGTACAE